MSTGEITCRACTLMHRMTFVETGYEQLLETFVHDTNNKLSSVLGLSELLLTFPHLLDDKETSLKYLRTIQVASADVADTLASINSLFKSKTEASSREVAPLDLASAVEQVVEMTRLWWKDEAQASGRFIEVKTQVQKVPGVYVSAHEFRSILLNLILNSVDALPEGGLITVRARQWQEQAIVEVEDTGIGMSQDVLKSCFEPSFSTKPGMGRGMGLASVHDTVHRFGGVIDVTSVPQKGTCFTIWLPLRSPGIPTG